MNNTDSCDNCSLSVGHNLVNWSAMITIFQTLSYLSSTSDRLIVCACSAFRNYIVQSLFKHVMTFKEDKQKETIYMCNTDQKINKENRASNWRKKNLLDLKIIWYRDVPKNTYLMTVNKQTARDKPNSFVLWSMSAKYWCPCQRQIQHNVLLQILNRHTLNSFTTKSWQSSTK